ncbi:MAG: tRNA glutamyl-Q(34) synthetase GluQRS [Bryobacteraceae bacterium]
MRAPPKRATYRGRFAPSPTGPLHFGSLVAAVASFLDARANGGVWLVRMEDVDTPRCVPGADRLILETLEAFSMTSDEPVLYQTARTAAYQEALGQLRAMGAAYECSCSRKDAGAGAYPGTCRSGPKNADHPLSWRVRFDDPELGDFVVRRSDGLFSYQLAVVVDDAEQQITHVVRGADLLESTPWQNHLQRLLGYSVPQYRHIPIVTNAAGEKLSKQTRAEPLDATRARELLREALRFLNQPDAAGDAPKEILQRAALEWR